MSVTSTLAPESRRVAGRPPKPPPTTTTRWRGVVLMNWSGRSTAAFGLDEPAHGVDERQVGEGLGEVAQVLTGLGIDLLRVELQRSGEGEQLLAQGAGAFLLADHAQRGHEPERADGE